MRVTCNCFIACHLRLQPEPPAKVINQSVLCTHLQATRHHSIWDCDWRKLIVAAESYLASMQRLAMHAAGVRASASASLGPRQVRVAFDHRILATFVVRRTKCDTCAALPMLAQYAAL